MYFQLSYNISYNKDEVTKTCVQHRTENGGDIFPDIPPKMV